MNKKGQSALEFLMTYGWAILVVLAAIGALAYFGVLSPTNFLPDQCLGAVGIGCVGKPDITSSGIAFIVVNGVGNSLTLDNSKLVVTASNASCTNSSVFFCAQGSTQAACGSSTMNIANGAQIMVTIKCGFPPPAAKALVVFNYVDTQTGFSQNLTMQVSGRVKQ